MTDNQATGKKVVITGPESAGKTTLAEWLTTALDGCLVPEYARNYVESLERPYCYEDLVSIAEFQIAEEYRISQQIGNKIMFLDTWLDVTKVWFDVVYGKVPDWVGKGLATTKIDLFLVCSPDLPWIPDPVRENGGEMRTILFNRYCHELENYGFDYEIIKGEGIERMQNALRFLTLHEII